MPVPDLGVLYARHMAHFGCGVAMFQPVASHDMKPPCVGYIDQNNRWNFIANVEWTQEATQEGLQRRFTSNGRVTSESGYIPLEREPMKLMEMGIEWRPRVSVGVRQYTVDANGKTPDNLPGGADAHIRYKSSNKFGAVLMAQKPITLISYNDETLFHAWLQKNRARLSLMHGRQLRRYGLWLVTRTYSTPKASITAWDARDKEANMSVKAKANMMGEVGADLDWAEKGSDKDWSHYSGQAKDDTVVVFFDGINQPSYKWCWENIKVSAAVGPFKRMAFETSIHRAQSNKLNADAALGPEYTANPRTNHQIEEQHESAEKEEDLLDGDLWGSSTPLCNASPINPRSVSRGREKTLRHTNRISRDVSTPRRLSRYLEYENNLSATDKADWTSLPARERSIDDRDTQATGQPDHRFSSASTATAFSARIPTFVDTRNRDISPSATKSKGELHRKTASPSLRQPS